MSKSNPFSNIGDVLGESGLMNQLLAESDRYEIEIDKIVVADQVRKDFDGESIRELAESIAEVGVLQNIIVNKSQAGFYLLIAGERRVMASEQAGKTTIPALVLDVDEETQRKIQLLENIQRENLSAVELAEELKTKLEQLGGDQDALAAHYNKSRAWVSKAMRMNELTGAAAEAMAVTSDQEALLAIQQLEQIEPEKAAALVDEIKTDFGKTNTRKKAQDELRTVKDDKKAEAEQDKAIKKQEKSKAKGEKSKAKGSKTKKDEEQIDLLPGDKTEPSPQAPDFIGPGPIFDENHPFYAGPNPVKEGAHVFHCDAESRIRAVGRMDMNTLNMAEDVPGIQKSVLAAIQKRRNELMKKLPGEPRKKESNVFDFDLPKHEESGGDQEALAAPKNEPEQVQEPEPEPEQQSIKHHIFSQSHNKYWLQNRMGYTDRIEDAGQFDSETIFEMLNNHGLDNQTLLVVHDSSFQ